MSYTSPLVKILPVSKRLKANVEETADGDGSPEEIMTL